MKKIKLTLQQKIRVKALIDALKSGKYLKCNGKLKINDSYCAEGVMCDVYKQRRKNGKSRWLEDNFMLDGKLSYFSAPPIVVKYYFGDNFPNLIEINDDFGWSFKKIASYINSMVDWKK